MYGSLTHKQVPFNDEDGRNDVQSEMKWMSREDEDALFADRM